MRVLRPVYAVGFLALLAGPSLAQAQDPYAYVEVRAGYTSPSGAASDSLKGQSSFGAGFAVAVGSRFHVGLSADWAHHSQKQADGSVIGGVNDEQWNLLHTFLKLSFDAVNSGKVSVALNAGPGLIVFNPNQNLRDSRGVRTDAHFAVNVGGSATWWFADRIGLVLSPQYDMAMKKTGGQIFTTKSAGFLVATGGFRFKI